MPGLKMPGLKMLMKEGTAVWQPSSDKIYVFKW
jgi:hypothetical protein